MPILWTVASLLLAMATTDAVGQEPTAGGSGEAGQLPYRIEAPGIENAFRLSPRLYSGGQPEADKGFETLKRLGVKTVISVDGSQPDVEAARRLGLRYVHLPVGYDGIPREQAIRLIEAVRALPGPLFVHCHHGKHRGPTAAAVCAMATENWEQAQARSWLERAGTDPRYRGLFATVDRFTPPSTKELESVRADQLPERAKLPELVETMVAIDQAWDHLKAIEKAGFRTPKDHLDLDPPHEALLLAEHLSEAARLDDVKPRGEPLAQAFAAAAQDARALEAALRRVAEKPDPTTLQTVKTSLTRVGQDCASCHMSFRDIRK